MIASVEAPLTLLQKPVKVFRFDAIESPQMTLRLVPEIFNPVGVIRSICKSSLVVDSAIPKRRYIQCILGFERLGLSIRNDRGVHFFTPLQ